MTCTRPIKVGDRFKVLRPFIVGTAMYQPGDILVVVKDSGSHSHDTKRELDGSLAFGLYMSGDSWFTRAS